MKSKFVDSSGLEALGADLENVLQGDQKQVIQNEDNFNWLVQQAEAWYLEYHHRLPEREDPDHFSRWGHKELFDLVFACAKEGLPTKPSNWPK